MSDDVWIEVKDVGSDEEILMQCWRELPFQVPYEEFRADMLTLREKHSRTSSAIAIFWKFCG